MITAKINFGGDEVEVKVDSRVYNGRVQVSTIDGSRPFVQGAKVPVRSDFTVVAVDELKSVYVDDGCTCDPTGGSMCASCKQHSHSDEIPF